MRKVAIITRKQGIITAIGARERFLSQIQMPKRRRLIHFSRTSERRLTAPTETALKREHWAPRQ